MGALFIPNKKSQKKVQELEAEKLKIEIEILKQNKK